MSAVTLDRAASSKLAMVQTTVEVLDDSGNFIGHFTPGTSSDPLAAEPFLSEEEQQKRESRTTGRTLREIMADLEKRA